MNRTNSSERPSIIQEIVFYDKPNIKPVVPEAILTGSSSLPLGKGDIVISRVRKTSLKHNQDTTKSPESKDRGHNAAAEKEFVKVEVNVLNEGDNHISNIDSLNHFINYENLGEDPLESVLSNEGYGAEHRESINALNSVKPNEKNTSIDKDNALSHNATEEPSLSVKKSVKSTKQSKALNDVGKESTRKKGKEVSKTEKISHKATKEDIQGSPFKKPKQPIQKARKAPQRVTMLDFLTKPNQKIVGSKEISAKEKLKSKEIVTEKATKDKTVKRSIRNSEKLVKSRGKTRNPEKESSKSGSEEKVTKGSPKKKGTESKKLRGRPKKTSGSESRIVKKENHYSDEDVSFGSPKKSKNYAELTNVPLGANDSVVPSTANTNNLEELLDEAQQHVRTLDMVEKDLESMFQDDQEEGQQITKEKRKAPGRKPKAPLMIIKKVKSEVEEIEDERDSREMLDTSTGEEYDSEEDSRGEWMPVEYAEYRRQHRRTRSKVYRCKYCGMHFSSYYGMRKHRALDHNDLGTDRKEGTFKESKCKQEKELDDSDEESRDEWMPQDYADYKMKHKMQKLKRVQWYKCKICCAVFSNYYKLSKHRIEHENKPNPYECKQCDSCFKDVESLMAHIRTHQGKDPYQCRKCEKGFSTKEELDEHVPVHILKRGPTPIKRFRCDICSKEFSKLCDIERHTRVHTGEKPSECNICHKRFQQSHNLSKHLLTHLHVKPFQCEICNKKFGRIDVLNRHLLTHSMEKPFKCELCTKGFIRQIQLTNHIAKSHTSSNSGLIVAEDESNNFEEGTVDDASVESMDNEEFEGEVVLI